MENPDIQKTIIRMELQLEALDRTVALVRQRHPNLFPDDTEMDKIRSGVIRDVEKKWGIKVGQ